MPESHKNTDSSGLAPYDGIPNHVAIIMDGNGRWAKERNRPRLYGHKKGAESVRQAVETAGEIGVKYLTLYAFSEENWGRPTDEVHGIFTLLDYYLAKEKDRLHKNKVCLRTFGRTEALPGKTQKLLADSEQLMRNNGGLTLSIALSYGSRQELTSAVKKLSLKVREGLLNPEDITPQHIQAELFTSGIPDPDLLIRTSGEQRISNFLLWQLAYSELYFVKKCWPSFTREDLLEAVEAYKLRSRRFGLLQPPSLN